MKLREQLADSFRLVWQNQLRPDIGERLKHEFSQMHSRMRQLQSLIVDLRLAGVEEVDVDFARNIARMIARPAKTDLDLSQLFPQIQRIAFVSEFKNRVQEFSRARFATDRIRFVDRRRKNGRLHTHELDNFFSRRAQIVEPIAKIRSERDGSSHFKCCRGKHAVCKIPRKRSRHGCHYNPSTSSIE